MSKYFFFKNSAPGSARMVISVTKQATIQILATPALITLVGLSCLSSDWWLKTTGKISTNRYAYVQYVFLIYSVADALNPVYFKGSLFWNLSLLVITGTMCMCLCCVGRRVWVIVRGLLVHWIPFMELLCTCFCLCSPDIIFHLKQLCF